MLENIRIQNETIPLIIKKSPNRKRTLSFHMTEIWLTIQIPLKTKEDYLEKIITKRLDWIYKHWQNLKNIKVNKIQDINIDRIYYRGEIYKLEILETDKKRCKINFENNILQIFIKKDTAPELKNKTIKKKLNEWYKKEAQDLITQETKTLAKIHNFSFSEIYIKNYKSKFWQCRAKDLYFNYKLIKLPIELIRHVILHELCHLKHKNHAKNFRNLLRELDENFVENKKYLKEKWSFILNI